MYWDLRVSEESSYFEGLLGLDFFWGSIGSSKCDNTIEHEGK